MSFQTIDAEIYYKKYLFNANVDQLFFHPKERKNYQKLLFSLIVTSKLSRYIIHATIFFTYQKKGDIETKKALHNHLNYVFAALF